MARQRQDAGGKSTTVDLTKGTYRRIYAGFLNGQRINAVSIEAEACFWRLQALCDDYGVFPADPRVLPVTAFPRRPVSPAKCERWVAELADKKLIHLFDVRGDRFGYIANFESLQVACSGNGKRIRRYPEAPNSVRQLEAEGSRGEQREAVGGIFSDGQYNQNQNQEQNHHQEQANASGVVGVVGGGGDTSDGWRAAAEERMVTVSRLTRPVARALALHALLTPALLDETWRAVVNDPSVRSRSSVFVRRLRDALGIPSEQKGAA